MDLCSGHSSVVLADSLSVNNSRLGMTSNGISYPPSASTFPSSLYLSIPRRKNTFVKVDESCFNGWIDSMKASLPPHKKLNMDIGVDAVSDEDISAYLSWMLKYQSALESFEQLTSLAKGKQIALFLDYDGTLSPIVNGPDCAYMSSAMRAAVRHAAKYFPTAIISGRSRDKVFEFVGLTEVHYAGSHGMDIMGPVRNSESVKNDPYCVKTTDKQGKEVHLFQPASKFLPMIHKVFRSLVKSTKGIKGVKVENNKFCASVHYRLVDEKNWRAVARIVQRTLKGYPDLRLTHGRKVLEIRPVINWNKGKAVEFLLESLGFGNSADVLPIFIGDDKTDEDAFKVLREREMGFGILVSPVPKETSAFYSLRDPSEVLNFLESLVKWKKSLPQGINN